MRLYFHKHPYQTITFYDARQSTLLKKGLSGHTGRMIVAAFDVGGARIGVALGTEEVGIASPWGIIDAKPEETCKERMYAFLQKEGVEKIVIGMPELLRERGSATQQQEHIRAWAERMFAGDSREVVYEDETLTTAMAAGYQRERGEKGKRDDLAAMAILQGYFDRYGRVSS